MFKNYESVLLLVTSNDEQLSPVTAPILFALSGRGEQGQSAGIARMRMPMGEEMMMEGDEEMESSSGEEMEEESSSQR